ncbi:hypothetical protein SAMN05192561_101839 [Halopenitus malekzadehii]|uniref:Uncharacterized protein n=1 Tax=Halopenitus malekzadehii TaxID=1267564 RepID=A0A1H6I657_9EURY|nr:hypothetical protein SAMN05192561_101839 [Halopenitus malekzadehii]
MIEFVTSLVFPTLFSLDSSLPWAYLLWGSYCLMMAVLDR